MLVLLHKDVIYIAWGIIWLVVGFLLALLISKGHYILVFKDHLKRLKLHFYYGAQTGGGKQLGNPGKILLQNPFLIFILTIIITEPIIILNSTVSILWVTALSIMATSFLWIWGSGERHIIFLSPFIPLLLLDAHYKDSPIMFYLSIVLSVVSIIMYLKTSYGKGIIPKETLEAYNFLNNHHASKTVLITPQIASPAFVYFVNKRIFAYPHDAGAMEFNRIGMRYRLNESDYIASLIKMNNVDTIMNQKKHNISALINKIHYEKVFANNLWDIYAVKRQK